jgi:hypothetical protein
MNKIVRGIKTFTLLPAVFFAFLFFSSCQKPFIDPNPAPQNPAISFLPKTYTEDYTSDVSGHVVITFNLSYDGNNRLVSMVSSTSSGDKFLFQYTPTAIITDIYNSNQLSIHEVGYLNASSYIDSTFQYNDTQDTSSERYLYNAGNQLVQINEYVYSGALCILPDGILKYTYDAGGNLVQETEEFNGVIYQSLTYEYTSLLNTLAVSLDYLPRNKYLKKTTHFDLNGTTGTLNHTYTFDSNNRLTGETIVANTGEVAIKTYTY